MNEMEKDFNEETLENSEIEKGVEIKENIDHTFSEEYAWRADEYDEAISGTVSEKNALSVYKPKLKKPKKRRVLLTAIVTSVVTTAICCGIFAMVMVNYLKPFQLSNNEDKTTPITDSQETIKNKGEIIKPVVNNPDAKALSIPEIYNKVSPSVVNVICTNKSIYGNSSSSGSGVIATADGYIITNNHVIDGASIITVKTLAGQSLDAQIVGKDERTDLAVIKVSSDVELPCMEAGDSTALNVGDLAVAIGNPLQEELVSTLTVGYISAIDRNMVINDRQMTMLQTDAAINPGNSGGALINAYGQVIGITTAKSTGYDVEGLGFAIPMNEAIPVVESIIKNGYVSGRPLIGIMGIDVTEQISKANDLPIGVYVDSVVSGGAAETGGIKPGDVIIKCDGKDIKSVDEINEIRDAHKVGDKLSFTVSRNGKEIQLNIVLQEEKPVEKTSSSEQPKNERPSDFFDAFGW